MQRRRLATTGTVNNWSSPIKAIFPPISHYLGHPWKAIKAVFSRGRNNLAMLIAASRKPSLTICPGGHIQIRIFQGLPLLASILSPLLSVSLLQGTCYVHSRQPWNQHACCCHGSREGHIHPSSMQHDPTFHFRKMAMFGFI